MKKIFTAAMGVALLDGGLIGVVDLLRVFGEIGWLGDPADLLPLFAYTTILGALVALLILLPFAILAIAGPTWLRRSDPWVLFHGIWLGANVALLFIWKRYAAVVEAGGVYHFSLRDLIAALLLGVMAGVVFAPALERFWRLAGSAVRWPLRRMGLGRMGVGATAAALVLGLMALPPATGTASDAPGDDPVLAGQKSDVVQASKNVILIIIDAVRPDHVGLYGYGAPTTPNLDALAENAIIATRYLVSSSYTIPSIASLFTSRNPAAHGVTGYGNVLREDFVTLAESFRDAGYETASFSATQLITPEFGFAQGFDTYRIFRDYRGDLFYGRVLNAMGIVRHDKRVDAQYLLERVLKWLDEPRERPFFMMVFFADPHFEYNAPAELVGRFADPDYLAVTDIQTFMDGYRSGELRDEESLQFARALYDAEIAHVDHAIGGLWRRVEELGEADQTILAVTSDHGEQFYEHGKSRHGKSLYLEEIHCPLVLIDPSWKGKLFVDAPTRGIDLFPTLLDMAGIEPPEGIEGASILPLARKGAAAEVRESLMVVSKANFLQAYWVHPWMLIFNRSQIATPADRGLELYHLEDDPGQRSNLAGVREDVMDRMIAALDSRVRASLASGPAPEKPIDKERLQLLRELHYVK